MSSVLVLKEDNFGDAKMSDVPNRSFLIRLAFDPILKPRLCGVQNALACGNCHEWYHSKIYFLVPQTLSKIEDLVELVRVEHGIQSGICFNVDGYNVPLQLPIENLKEIKEPIEVLPIGPEVPKVNFPRCNCATAADSDQVDLMILKLNGTKIEETAEINGAETSHKPEGRQSYMIPCCQSPDGDTENEDRQQSSNASSELADVAASQEMNELNGSQDGVLDQSEDPNGDNLASGNTSHVSSSTTHESLNNQGYNGSDESGESTGSEDMGSAMAVFSKQKQEQNEHGSVDSGSENASTSSLEQSKADGPSENSSVELPKPSSSTEETIESGEEVSENEVQGSQVDVEEASSYETITEATLSNASALDENIHEDTKKRSGSALTTEEMGIPEKKTRTHPMIPDSATQNESLRAQERLTGQTMLSEDAEDFHEGLIPWSSTPRPSITNDILNGKSPSNHLSKIFDSTIASEDGNNDEPMLSQDDFHEQGQETTEKLFTKSVFI